MRQSDEKQKKQKMQGVMTVLLILLVALSIWIYWGNTSIQTTQIRINSERIPVSFNGFRIVHVSDLHNAEFGANQSRLIGAVKDASPDLIAITGDLIDSRHTDIEKAMDFINSAVRIAPVYYVTGNHEARTKEYAKLEAQMSEAGIVILKDEGTIIEWGGDSIRLLGLNDPSFALEDNRLGDNAVIIDTKLKSIPSESNEYTILLSHRPELFDVYVTNSIDLVLSGHAHGGQVRLPFVGGLVVPNQGFFPVYSEGVYEKDQTRMVVSRGLGNSIVPVRVNNRPELVIVILAS